MLHTDIRDLLHTKLPLHFTRMSASIIDPEYNWKQAASQEGVDYDAVRKSFMDQAYGFVANKAKVLFQDPFRLGFEIVHRNEKATKMVGIFAFRCNNALLYAPVFFVNGEIKAADMLYRGDVKRFVPLTDEWCAFLVRGANQEPGQLTDKNRQRQPDAYLDRLAYPQRVKYAMHDEAPDSEVLRSLLSHCSGDEPMRKIMPDLISDGGPDTLEKLASLIESSELATRFLVENYTEAELTNVTGWQEKKAAETPLSPEEGNIVLVRGAGVCKSASERESVMDRGYALVDNRSAEKKASIVEIIDSGEINELTAGCGHAKLMMADGDFEDALILRHDYDLLTSNPSNLPSPVSYGGNSVVYLTKTKQLKRINDDHIFGEKHIDGECSCTKLTAGELKSNQTYVRLSADGGSVSEIFVVIDRVKDGECSVISYRTPYSYERKMLYSPNREKYSSGEFISDDVKFLEVDANVKRDEDSDRIEEIVANWNSVMMNAAGIDRWMRTAGNITESVDVEIKVNNLGLFDITAKDIAGNIKVANDLGMLAAHLKIANDFEITTDTAGEILDKTVDDSIHRFRVFDSSGKCAFMTRMQSMSPWIEGFDPELGVKVDTPQRQIINTHTPLRAQQTQRYGDHYQRHSAEPRRMEEDGLPDDAIFSKSPEELAQLAQQYNMPHIFDHGMLGHMAKATFNTIGQMQQYIPDLETGVDRYYRILFLLRYRPADFEEAYGKDELMEMEHDFSELASTAGNNLLRLLKRLDLNKTTNQGS